MSGIHVVLMVACCLIWGGNTIVNKIAITDVSPIALTLLRFIFALPFLFWCKAPRIPILNIALVSLSMAGQWISMNMALRYGLSASVCVLVVNVGTVFGCIFCYLFFGRKPTFYNKVGIAISLLGLSVLSCGYNKGITLIGFLFGLVAAICYALVNVLSKWTLKESNEQWPFTVYTSSLTFFIVLPFFFMSGGQLHLSLKEIACVSYSGLFSNLLGMYVVSYLLTRYDAYKVMQYSTLVPIFGFLGGALFLGERITEDMVLAFAFIIIGLLVSNGG
jgi:O-acetylserine/cysteine efflux transporter